MQLQRSAGGYAVSARALIGLKAPSAPVSAPLFGKEEPKQPDQPVKKQDRLQKWISRWLLVAPLSSLMGGVCLLASSVLPGETPKKPALLESAMASTQKKAEVASPEETPLLDETDVTRLKEILASLGLYLGGIGLFSGNVSGLFLGYREKQPSMVVGSLWGMAAAPLVALDPSLAMKATYLLSTVFWLSGFANKMHNDFQLKPGQKRREYDMVGLLYPRTIQQDPADPRSNLARIWGEEALRTLKFTAEDQMLVVLGTKDAIKQALQHPEELKEKIRRAVAQTREYCREGSNKPLPDFLKPNAEQNQVGATLMYSGIIPMLILDDSSSLATVLAPIPVSVGGAVAGTSLFTAGLNRKDMTGKALLTAFPTMLIGNAYIDTNAGMGALLLGTAATNNYFRAEYLRLQAAQEAANDNNPSEKPSS